MVHRLRAPHPTDGPRVAWVVVGMRSSEPPAQPREMLRLADTLASNAPITKRLLMRKLLVAALVALLTLTGCSSLGLPGSGTSTSASGASTGALSATCGAATKLLTGAGILMLKATKGPLTQADVDEAMKSADLAALPDDLKASFAEVKTLIEDMIGKTQAEVPDTLPKLASALEALGQKVKNSCTKA